jgi:hypothetical protein
MTEAFPYDMINQMGGNTNPGNSLGNLLQMLFGGRGTF